ncbi:hypothetical protein DFAR_270002 [Desulfarculales bacterium]
MVPVLKTLMTLEEHAHLFLSHWTSSHSNARLEGLNDIFLAARARARGYLNVFTFMAMIYCIAAPLGSLSNSTVNDKKPKTLSWAVL